MANLTIGKLAKQIGVGVETLRYYERRGLLQPQRRAGSGYRQYSRDDHRRLRFIRRAQTLGFSLDEVAELLSLRDRPGESAADVKLLAREKIEDIEMRIRDLKRMKSALGKLEKQCPGHEGTTAECPILAALNQDGSEIDNEGAA